MSESTIPAGSFSESPQERLTRQFYEWERRGRGWQVHPHAVQLEPPFRSFSFDLTPVRLVPDDGRKPTFFSSLLENLTRKQPRDLPTQEHRQDEQIATPDEGGAFIEFRISLPPDTEIAQTSAEQFLLNLSFASGPISFEVLGTDQSIEIHFASLESDSGHLVQQLRSYFPEALITQCSGRLERTWEATATEGVIIDFGLSREFMLPLAVASGFHSDPLIAVTGAMSCLQPGELALLQVLFRAAQQPWAESALRAVTGVDGTGCFFANAPEVKTLARRKLARPLFAAVIRTAAKARSETRARQIAKNVGSALAQFSFPTGNELVPLSNEGYEYSAHEQSLLHHQSFRCGMLLSSEELVSLVHLPSCAVTSEKLSRAVQNTRSLPAIAVGHPTVIGINTHSGVSSDVTLSSDQRAKHAYVIGASGTGKSTLLLNLILQDIENGEGLAVLDPHGDLIDQIMSRIPERRIDDVVLLDLSDEDYPVAFNILSAHSEAQKNLLSSDLVAVFQRLSTSWGDQMTSVLGNAVAAFLDSTCGGTLADLRRFLIEPQYRAEFLSTVTDSEIVYYWQRVFPLITSKPQGPLLTRLDTFLRPKLIRNMVVQQNSSLDFRAIMNEGKIFLAKLSQGTIGEENSYLLGSLAVSNLHQAAMTRQELLESERRPFYLYIDEFHNFITPSMAAILSGARKYKLGLVLAHQEFRQLWNQNTDVASAVIANPYTRICFRLGDFDAKKLEEGFCHFTAADLQNLGVGEAIARIERSEYDFNLKTSPLNQIPAEAARMNRLRVVQTSRQKYARPRKDVELELQATIATDVRPSTSKPQPDREQKARSDLVQAAPVLVDSAPSSQPTPPSALPTLQLGRGAHEHKYLQHLIKRLSEDRGFFVTIEQPVLGGDGSIDVALEKGSRKIAFEISVTSSPESELKNIEKCLAAGFTQIIVVGSKGRALSRIKKRAEDVLTPESLEAVRFIEPDELPSLLDHFAQENMATESTVKGYKVKVKQRLVSGDDAEVRKATISKVLLKSLQRLRKGSKE